MSISVLLLIVSIIIMIRDEAYVLVATLFLCILGLALCGYVGSLCKVITQLMDFAELDDKPETTMHNSVVNESATLLV